MNDTEILSEMKPEEVSLGDIYHCLESLDHSACAIFYCTDKDGVLRVVVLRWVDVGWYVYADSVENPDRWCGGYRVFSRRFLDTVPLTLGSSVTLILEARVAKLEADMDLVRKHLIL
jgi:hypothetical protein